MAVKVDFCSTTSNLVCATETIVGLIPIIAFLYFGYFSIQETRGRTAYHREKYTFRHLSKLILSSLISLTTLIFLVVYILKETEISLKTAITAGVSFMLWVYNSFLIRKEYNCLGYTTNHLRIAWITMFVCELILLIFALAGKNTDDFAKVELIYILDLIFNLSIIIIGFVYSDDYPPETPKHDNYKSLMDDSIHVIEDGYFENSAASLDRSVDKSMERSQLSEAGERDSFFRPFEETVEGPGNRPSRREGSIRENNEVYSVRDHLGGPSNVNLKQDIGFIQDVNVTDSEEIIRDTKLTTVYVIEYHIRGLQFMTKRSYSEFEALRKNIKKMIKRDRLEVTLPEIPPKKGIGKTTEKEGIEERRVAFDHLLKAIVNNKVGFAHLADFLQSPHVLELYQKISKKNKIKEAAAGLIHTVSGKEKSEASKDVKTKVLDSGPGTNMILDYTHAEGGARSQSMTTANRHYTVETVGIFDGVDKSTNYKFRIIEKNTGQEHNVSKRYTDFKNLHSALKKEISSNDKKLLPELPYKSSNQALALRDDQRVIEYRKVALKTYLANILNNPRLQNYRSIRDFINPQSMA